MKFRSNNVYLTPDGNTILTTKNVTSKFHVSCPLLHEVVYILMGSQI
jgi:hypothetical protein